MAFLHWRSASLNPSHRLRSDWFWAHSRNCLISHEQAAPVAGAGAAWTVAGAAAGAAAVSLDPPLKSPVMAWPMVCPTAEPMATPPAVAAIWPMRDGCCGWATMGAVGGAWAGSRDGAGAGAAAAGLTLKRDKFLTFLKTRFIVGRCTCELSRGYGHLKFLRRRTAIMM